MEPPPPRGTATGTSSTASLSTFQPASALPRSTHVPSTNSNRNASGGLPPLPPPDADKDKDSSSASATPTAPSKPVNRPVSSRNAIVHSVLQRRNPILPLIRNVGLEIGDIVADYQVGAHSGVLFLSLKYHRLHPEYIFGRIEKMRNVYNLRILLILCDINEHQQPLRELSKVAVVNDLTVIVAFSNEEAAQYLTTFKAYEHKSADTLKERIRQTYPEQLEHVLTSGRKVNKANAETLAATFGSFANMVRQPSTVLTGVKGIGPTKTLSLYRAFNEPFMAGGKGGKAAMETAKGRSQVKEDEYKEKDKEEEDEIIAISSSSPPQVVDDATASKDEVSAQHAGTDENGAVPTNTLPDGANGSPDARSSGGASPGPRPGSSPSLARPADTPPTPRRPDDNGPSRSPSVEPDEEHTATNAVWEDPLADNSDEEDADERPAKRARV